MDYQVVLGLKSEIVGGVEIFSTNLARELNQRGIAARILLTQHYRPGRNPSPFPTDLTVDKLPVTIHDTWRNRWQKMIEYLEKRSPCIYIPNSDVEYSSVSPKLSRNVIVVGILHCDSFFDYEHVMRMGKYWNGIVAVSAEIAEKTALLNGNFAQRLTMIPNGIHVPSVYPKREFVPENPLQIVYVGRLVQKQKRILDLHSMLSRLLDSNIPVKLTVIGDGAQRMEFERASENFISRGIVRIMGILPNEEVLKMLEQQDVILLTSDFEGMPICLLEAMGRGCVPVVTDIRSGIPELIADHSNGFILCHNDLETFVERICVLKNDLNQRQLMSRNAYETIKKNYNLAGMTDQYINFFNRVFHESQTGIYSRPAGPILPPPRLTITWKEYIPTVLRRTGGLGKRLFRETKKKFT